MVDGTSHSGAVHTNNSQSSKYSAPCRAGAGGKAIAMRTISRPKISGAISPPPYAQSSPTKPNVEGAQSPPAAHRDDSLATNPSAGLVAEDHPPKRRRGGWGRAGVLAVVACLAWLAYPTAAFAQTNTISISSVAGDNVVTASEKWNGFKITGHTGNQSNIPVVVTFGTETWNTTSTTLIDGNYWWSVSVPGKSSYITDGDNQTVNAEATFSGGIKLSHSRTFNVDLTLPLVVDAVTGDDVINDGAIHITGDTGDIGSVRIDLVIGTGSFVNASDLAGEWLQTVLAADNQSYITGSSATLSVTATKTGYEPSATVSRTLTKDLVHPSVSYTAPLSLQVGVEITPITPTTSDTDIVSYLFSNPLPGLSLNGVTGVISGTPTTFNASTRRSTVIATDAADNHGTATIDFPVVVAGTLTLNVDDDIAGDDTINIAEKASGFTISGDTGAESGVTVTVTIDPDEDADDDEGSLADDSNSSGAWSVSVPGDATYISGTSVSLSVTATKPHYTSVTVTRSLTVDLTAPAVSYTAPQSLTVGVAITAIDPTTNDTDIVSYAISSDSLPLPRGLSLNGATGVISGMPTTGNPNTETVEVLATDDAGNTGTAMIDFPPVAGPEPGVTVDPPAEDLPPEGLSVPEGGSVQYTLVLDTEPTHAVTIQVSLASGDDDLTAAPTTLTFTTGNWYEEQTVTVSAAEEDDGEAGIGNFAHNAVSTDSIYNGIPAPGVKAFEADNDPIGVTVWPQVLRMSDGGSAEYAVVLNTEPADSVEITVTRDHGGDADLTATPDQLTFLVSNWSEAQKVTVSAAKDADQVDGVAVFSHSVSSDEDDNYSDDEITIDTVTAIEDETRPRVEIQTEASAAVVGGAFEVTILFSEPVEGFELEDIEVSNGTASNFNRVSSRTYTVTITPEETGEVRVEVGSKVARDRAGNRNRAAAEPLVIEADLERPEVTIEGPTEPVGLAGFEVRITFSEPVTGFELEDIRVTNGTASNFIEISPQEYTATITPEGIGEVRVEVPEEVAEDAAGNGNRAAEPFVIEADLERPEVTIEGPTEPVGMAGFEVTITFSEPVTGFELEDIRVTNGTASNFIEISPQEYTATITPEGIEVRVEVPEEVAEDAAGNGNRAAEPFVIEADLKRPAVTIEGPTEPVGMAGFEVTITFSEPVAGFELEDIRVTNGTASNFIEILPQEYTATITPEGIEVRVEVPEEVAEDAAGNGNRAAEPFVIEADLKRPAVTIEGPTEPVGMAGFEVTITFSEPVAGFELEDIRVTNGTASNFIEILPQEYTAEITPSASGAVTLEVGEDVARDGVGNGNRAAEPLVIEADLERPEVTIEGPTEPVGMAGFEVTITFSEPVAGFELEDIRVTNGTASNFIEISPQEYTAEITPSASGAVTLEVGEDVARDGVGNGNRAAEPLVIEADLERPKVTIAGPTESVGMAGFEVRIAFSEPVEGFELEDIRVTNGTVSNFTKVSPQEYTATITPEEIGEVRVEIPEEVAEDGAGNGNQAAEAFEVETRLAVSYQQESYTAREGGEAVTVTVKLSQSWDEELAIPIRVTPLETTEVADYTVEELEDWDAQQGAGRLTFPAEETEQTFTIEANHDGDGDDETVELGFGELPEMVLAGEPGVATVMLEDKGLVELKVSFGQSEYQIREGQQADIEVKVAPPADRRVEVPLVVSLKGGATDEDYSGVPAALVIEEGESEGTISVEVLADEVNDPGEGIVLSLGELPEAVSEGEISQTTVNFRQQRTAEQFSQTLEVALAVMARSMGESAQTAIEGRFERHRQWSRLGAGAAVPTAQPGSDKSNTGLGEGESERIGSESLDGSGSRRAEGPVAPSAGAGARAAMGSSGESGDRESGLQGTWLQNVSLGGLAGLFGYGQSYAGVSSGSGRGPSGTGPTVGLGGQPGYGQNRFQGWGAGDRSLRSGSAPLSGRSNQELNLAGASFELPLAGQQKGRSRSWVPALWGQGDLQRFNGNLTRLGMSYRGGLEAAHVGLDVYANDKVLAGLSFMHSWGNMDYSDDGIDGVLGSRMNTFHPYLYWQATERVSVWGMGGLGRGQVEVNEPGRSHDFEADFRMFAGG